MIRQMMVQKMNWINRQSEPYVLPTPLGGGVRYGSAQPKTQKHRYERAFLAEVWAKGSGYS